MLGINNDPVTIKSIELAIVDRAFDEGWIVPRAAARRAPGRRSRSSARARRAWPRPRELNRAGHSVTVFEKADRIGGLLRYGIPEFKLEKRVLDRRLDLLEAEGVVFRARRERRRRRRGRATCAATSTRCCWPAAPASRAIWPCPAAISTACTSPWTT